MAVTVIEQAPIVLSNPQPVGQDFIFVVSNSTAVANEKRVKFIAQIHVSDTTPPNPNTTTHLKGTFKTTPNNAGVGMFNVRNIIENYVKADNMAAEDSEYKGVATDAQNPHPLHLIDDYSKGDNIARWLQVRFSVEYLDADTASSSFNKVVEDVTTREDSNLLQYFNAYLKYTDKLFKVGNNFSFDISPYWLFDNTKKFLSNAPTEQYANIDDYGTLGFIPNVLGTGQIDKIYMLVEDNTGAGVVSLFSIFNAANGATSVTSSFINTKLLYVGCFPGNLQNRGDASFQAAIANGSIYGGKIKVVARDSGGNDISQTYTININCLDKLGYEPIRLCWLNQWGAWDYYTFTKKSTKTISTQGSTYTQLEGTWNESYYRTDTFKGGKKSFRVNATEKIKINTDFVSEIDNVMFEELTNSPEVYILEGFQDDPGGVGGTGTGLLNNYVTPVRLLTTSLTKKTLGNDKLIQYTFEVEKTKTLRTQSI